MNHQQPQDQQPNSMTTMGLPRTRRPPPLQITTPSSTSSSALPSAISVDEPLHNPPQKARSLRNMKNLSLALPSPHSSASEPRSAVSGKLEIPSVAPSQVPRPRRPSIISLPSSSNALGLLRKDEDGSPTVPYSDGPIQIIPGIWLGSEDNARDWKGLVERGIKSILNVAKEVSSPFDPVPSSQPLRPFASTPNLKASDSTYHPPHPSSGRPAMRYLKLQWSHGQHDLVDNGFPEAMKFTDAALTRHEGVLVHCQCGISRSATMVIALVMRAAAESSPSVPPEVWALKGMQGAYDYVKERSRWVGPNMSLIYQLLEYERRLKGPTASPSASSRSSALNEEEEEWGRQRRLLDETPSEPEEQQVEHEVMREALALDKAMEDRMIARQSSHSSLASAQSGQGMGMGTAWRSRFGRKRTGSVASNFTTNSGSVLSEDLVEEDEEQELLGVGGGFDRSSSGEAHSPDSSPSELESRHDIPPPSAPVWKTSFEAPPPPMTAVRSTFSFHKNARRQHTPSSSFQDIATTPRASSSKGKRRPPPLGILPPVPPSPIALVQEDASPTAVNVPRLALTIASPEEPPAPRTRKRTESRKPAPPPLHLRNNVKRHTSSVSIDSTSTTFSSQSTTSQRSRSSHSSSQHSTALPPPTATQTLFVFPPSPTNTRTPSTMTLMSNAQAVPFPTITPRVSTYSQNGRRKSFIGIGVPPTPTTACSRVDARGWFGVE